MRNKHRKKRKFDGKNFIILPFIFCILLYFTLFFTLSPVLSPLLSAANLFFSENEKDFSTDYNNIFVPIQSSSGIDSSGVQTNENSIGISEITFPKYGEQFGELSIEDCGIDVKLFFGDGNVALRNGVGVFNGSSIPGYGKTILVAGHNTTFFNGLKYANAGQIVSIATSYGNYTYEITSTAVKKASDKEAYDLNAEKENLVLYTCYPFDELGLTQNRFFVYAKYVSGPHIDKNV